MAARAIGARSTGRACVEDRGWSRGEWMGEAGMGPWEGTAGGGGPLVLASRWRWIGVEGDGVMQVRVLPCSVGCRYPHLSFFAARPKCWEGGGLCRGEGRETREQ